MAGLHDLKRRITSVQKTKKITQALNMVAASKFRRAQTAILSARPYEQNLRNMLADILKRKTSKTEHLYFKERTTGKTLLVVISADKGLCGGFNTSIFKKTVNYLQNHQQQETELYVLGNKAVKFLTKNFPDRVKYAYRDVLDKIEYARAIEYADELVNIYLNENIKEIVFIYNEYKSAIAQNVVMEQFLPIDGNIFEQPTEKKEPAVYLSPYIYEPDLSAVLDRIAGHFIRYKMFRIMTESFAAEQGARMTAMDAATENAKEVIAELELKYNRERQARITAEIAEIIAGAVS